MHLHLRGEARRVDLLHRRREHQIGSRLRGQLRVARLLARIALEVGAAIELRRVHEHRHHHHVAAFPREADEREVPLVQSPHRGHQPDRTPCKAIPLERGAQRTHGAHRWYVGG